MAASPTRKLECGQALMDGRLCQPEQRRSCSCRLLRTMQTAAPGRPHLQRPAGADQGPAPCGHWPPHAPGIWRARAGTGEKEAANDSVAPAAVR